jgi:hypothetical protein
MPARPASLPLRANPSQNPMHRESNGSCRSARHRKQGSTPMNSDQQEMNTNAPAR